MLVVAKETKNPRRTGVLARGSGRSRTDDDGFAIRCSDDSSDLAAHKLQPSESSGCTPGCTRQTKIESGCTAAAPVAVAVETGSGELADSEKPCCDPDLAKILAAWPTLAEPLKRAVLALIGTVEDSADAVGSRVSRLERSR